jgi:RND family efflux transporter MFP subunit
MGVSQSNLKLAQVTADRTKALTEQGILAKQELDDRLAAVSAADASVRAALENTHAQESVIAASESSVRRLLEQKNYARMVAPYDGMVTYRNPLASDLGTLISAGSGTGSREILRVSQVQKLRVFVDVPQSQAPLVRLNQPATLTVDEFPGRVFPAKVSSTTGVVDPVSRTMLTVLVYDNAAGALMPGMYVKAQFRLAQKVNVLRLPSEALISNAEGTAAAVVGADNKVHLRKITVGRDWGGEVEVNSGLADGDRVVLNPSDSLKDGATVEPRLRAKTAK